MPVSPLLILFVGFTFFMGLVQLLMVRQIKRADSSVTVRYFGRGSRWATVIKEHHKKLFPTSWIRDLFLALIIIQTSLFVVIIVGIALNYR